MRPGWAIRAHPTEKVVMDHPVRGRANPLGSFRRSECATFSRALASPTFWAEVGSPSLRCAVAGLRFARLDRLAGRVGRIGPAGEVNQAVSAVRAAASSVLSNTLSMRSMRMPSAETRNSDGSNSRPRSTMAGASLIRGSA